VVAHLAFVGQEGDDVRCGRPWGVGDVVDDLVLESFQTGFLLGTFSSHGFSCSLWCSEGIKAVWDVPGVPLLREFKVQ